MLARKSNPDPSSFHSEESLAVETPASCPLFTGHISLARSIRRIGRSTHKFDHQPHHEAHLLGNQIVSHAMDSSQRENYFGSKSRDYLLGLDEKDSPDSSRDIIDTHQPCRYRRSITAQKEGQEDYAGYTKTYSANLQDRTSTIAGSAQDFERLHRGSQLRLQPMCTSRTTQSMQTTSL
ncbi:hypothetical protein BaRGS_00005512 [Batillaria attramentaria]|uniref:Uncharacterized protein n=1 Tax=Batillaria attramentaria TaxID=370345 RepID=A0ABD0LWA6_9CAEN